MAPDPLTSQPARSDVRAPRWLARHRRLLLVFAVVLAFALVPMTWVLLQHWQRQQAIANIHALGGYVAEADSTYSTYSQWTDGVRGITIDRLLTPFVTPSQYKRVDLWFKPATDADLERIAVMSDLSQLNLSGTKITDHGLASLSGLNKLESLELAYTQITDAGLVHLKGMTRLERLRLDQCAITDASIPHLQSIPSPGLFVHLRGTKVTAIKAGELQIEPVGANGVPRVGRVLLIRGSCTVADPSYILKEIDIDILGHEEGSDEASHFGNATCEPSRNPETSGRFDFQIQLPAPKRPGDFKVVASTFATLHGFSAFYTAGLTTIHVQPATAGERGANPPERANPKD